MGRADTCPAIGIEPTPEAAAGSLRRRAARSSSRSAAGGGHEARRAADMWGKRLARVPGVRRGCAGCACRTYAALGVTCTSWFVYVIRVCGDEVGGDEPAPGR
ncbi:MAG: hypothetical protein GX492_05945 [Firmicutes bacterium]|nr:hypothetical protein [Bacillota bacterium]